ncbi:unnamed protein product [Camellia sinensis]
MCKGYEQKERERLKIKSFYLRLWVSNTRTCLPDSITLYYLPRINGSPLEICDSKIQADSPGFVTLYRVVSGVGTTNKTVIFGSRERVRASEGVRFEVYMRDEKVFKGSFRKDENDEWKVECKCVLEREMVGVEVKEAEISVAVDGQEPAMMSEKVEVVVRRKTRAKYCFQGLEEIPEEREVDDTTDQSDACCCCCCCCSSADDDEMEKGSDGGDCGEMIETEMEGVRWAVDVGFWVMCLGVGVGYLVSKASSKTLRPRRLL